MWILNLLKFLGYSVSSACILCDNQAALNIANNPVFHEHTKHIEVDCHFIRERIVFGEVRPQYTSTTKQLVDIFTKALGQWQFHYLLGKLGILNPHAPT